jgi:ring-1,2-phenylacetyl-CoA epoxidase subunit PaaE
VSVSTALEPGSPARGAFHALAVAAVDRLCDDAVAVTFEVPDRLRAQMAFGPGQHVNVRRVVDGVEHRRTYSLCGPAGGPLRIGVRTVPGGVFSGWLVQEARVGDLVEVQQPTGRFTLDPAAGGRHVLVGAGSGITPLLSIAASLLERSDARVTLLYGNRRTATVMFLEELADLKNRHPDRFELVHVLSREPRDADLLSGRLDGERLAALLRALVPVPEVGGFWLCGPLAMVEEHRRVLDGLGVGRERVHVELFHVDTPPPPVVHAEEAVAGEAVEVGFTLDGRTTSTSGPRTGSVLETAQQARPDVPFACRGGVCGTCRARVVEGRVEMHRNYALEDEEVRDGFVLTCQAYPVTDRVLVDFDA